MDGEHEVYPTQCIQNMYSQIEFILLSISRSRRELDHLIADKKTAGQCVLKIIRLY